MSSHVLTAQDGCNILDADNVLRSEDVMPGRSTIYVFGTKGRINGCRVMKIGRTAGGADALRKRCKQHENDLKKLQQPHELRLLAAFISFNSASDEAAIKRAFPIKVDGHNSYSNGYIQSGSGHEFYFNPPPEMIEWARNLVKLPYVASGYAELDMFYKTGTVAKDFSSICPEQLKDPQPSQLVLFNDVSFAAEETLTLTGEGAGEDDDLWRDARAVVSTLSEGDYYTPDSLTAAARTVMGGIDLDPASCALANKGDHAHAGVRAAKYFTIAENGLTLQWNGRIWLNPPFSQWDRWIPHLMEEMKAGRVTEACILAPINATTATPFFRTGFVYSAERLMITEGRPGYWGPKAGSPTSGHAIYYFGPNGDKFAEQFGMFGVVYPRSFQRTGSSHVTTEIAA